MNQNIPEFTVDENRNPNFNFSPDEEAALKKSQEDSFVALKEQQAQRIAQRADEVSLRRALNRETIEALGLSLPDLEARREQFKKRYLAELDPLDPRFSSDSQNFERGLDDINSTPKFLSAKSIGIDSTVIPSLNTGQFEWIRTRWYSSFKPELRIENPDRYLRFFGQKAHDNNDDFLPGSLGVTLDFYLNSPLLPIFRTRRWSSIPLLYLNGVVSGFTGLYNSLWAADDKLCKCSIFMKQTVRQSLGGDNMVIGSAQVELPIINLENSRPFGQQETGLLSLYMPYVAFELRNFTSRVYASLKIRFDIQLEGESDIWFRLWGGRTDKSIPSLENSVLLEVPNWGISPLLD